MIALYKQALVDAVNALYRAGWQATDWDTIHSIRYQRETLISECDRVARLARS